MYTDSTGKNQIVIGDKVRFRGEVYTISGFNPQAGRGQCAGIFFVETIEPPHHLETPDEWSVDKE